MIRLFNLCQMGKNSKLVRNFQDIFRDMPISYDMSVKRMNTEYLGFPTDDDLMDFICRCNLYEVQHGNSTLWKMLRVANTFESRYQQAREFVRVIMNTPEYNYSVEHVVFSVGGHNTFQPGKMNRIDGAVYRDIIPERTRFFI